VGPREPASEKRRHAQAYKDIGTDVLSALREIGQLAMIVA
jgi:hypothetical protein